MPIDRSALGGLSVQSVSAIRGVLATHPSVAQAILFGSRAKGNYKNGSDIDLALTGRADYSELAKIAGELDDLLLPWEIDLVQFDKITNPDLREHINRVGQPLYQASAIQQGDGGLT
jgi:predicted nucleotidyltransferase